MLAQTSSVRHERQLLQQADLDREAPAPLAAELRARSYTFEPFVDRLAASLHEAVPRRATIVVPTGSSIISRARPRLGPGPSGRPRPPSRKPILRSG